MDFIYLLRVLSKRKWVIIGSAFIAALIAYFLTRNDPKLYRSIAQVSTGYAVSDQIVLNDNKNFFESETRFNTAIVTMTSPPVVGLLSYQLILHDLTSDKPFRQLTREQKEDPVYREITGNKAEAERIFSDKLDRMSVLTSYNPEEKRLLEFLKLYKYDYKSLSEDLNVYRLQHTDYLQLDYNSENPDLSAYVVNHLFEQFERYYTSVLNEKSSESIDTLRSLMDKKKEILDAKNAALQARGLSSSTEDQNKSTFDLVKELETKLADEKSKLTTYTFQLKSVDNKLNSLGSNTKTTNSNEEVLIAKKAMNGAYATYLSDPTDANLNTYNRLKAEYQNKVMNAGTVTTAKDPTAELTDLLNKKSDLEVDIDAANTNIRNFQNRINTLHGDVEVEASRSASAETLLKEADQANSDYLSAKQKYNDAIDIKHTSGNNFRQVLYGQPAIEPEPSKRILIVGMAGMSVLVISVLIIVFLTYLDSSIKTPAIFSKMVGLRLISMVNYMNLKNKELFDIVAYKHAEDNAEKKRDNIFRESVRKLRYEIESSGKRIFLFTSTKKGQGKTTLIQALSYSLSLSKKKILIIDTNFCNNDLTQQLNGKPVLEKIDTHQINGALLSEVKDSATVINDSIYLIGSEGGDYTPSEILPRQNILHHLQHLLNEFDYIFLEGPPLNDFSDSKELAQYVDGVIAVFSAQGIIKQIDKESISFFKGLNGKFCGSILNMVELENVNVT